MRRRSRARKRWHFASPRAAIACSVNGRQLGLTPEETDAYAKAVVQADFEESGEEDVVRKLFGDLTAAGVETDEAAVRRALAEKMIEARRQLMQAEQG
jgi:hypothetical protein